MLIFYKIQFCFTNSNQINHIFGEKKSENVCSIQKRTMDEQAGPSTKRSRHDEVPVKIIHITGLKLNRFSKYFRFHRPNVSLVQSTYFNGVKKTIHKIFLTIFAFNAMIYLFCKRLIFIFVDIFLCKFQLKKFYELFRGFGEIHQLQCRSNNCFTIEFKDEQIAAQLLKKKQLLIDGNTLQMRANNENQQSISNQMNEANEINPLLLEPPPAQDSPKNILNALNDHCLCVIFQNINHLSDFHSIANVCVKFNQIAQLVFSSKIRSRWINFEDLVFFDRISDQSITDSITQLLESFLSNFGSSIVSFKFHRYGIAAMHFKLIHKYCKNMRCFDVSITTRFQHEIADVVRSIFSKLTKLHINFLQSPSFDFISVIQNFSTKLEELEIRGLASDIRMPNVTFPNLMTFSVSVSDELQPSIKEFLAKNLQIEKLSLKIQLSIENVQFISQNMKNLKKIQLFSSSATEIERLNLLSNATINLDGIYCDDRIHRIFHLQNIAQISLHEFHFMDRTLPIRYFEQHLIAVAQNLRNLEKIKIHSKKSISMTTMKQVVQHANKLLEFYQTSKEIISNQFTENDYNEILSVILARKQHQKLTMTIQIHQSLGDTNPFEYMIILNNKSELEIFNYNLENLNQGSPNQGSLCRMWPFE